MTRTAYEAEVETGGPGRQIGRLLATLLGVALLVVGAFLDWTPSLTGDKLNIKALVQSDFAAESDFVRTVGGVSVLIGLVALIGLVDRTGWLTRLAGAAALVVFVLFAIEAYRVFGHDFNTAVGDLRAGAWLQLAGGVVLLIGGYLGSRVVAVPAAVETAGVDPSTLEGRR
ncbi:MAG TPA: sugar:proton symporter [Actinospica sp.]|nr:sugar:proton symporter [Actinospica sp.]